MADELPELPKKPSFFSSVASGIGGFFKGALSGGAIGIIGGSLLALAAVGIAAVAGAPVMATATAIGATMGIEVGIGTVIGAVAAAGAVVGGTSMAAVGAAAGTMTGVVRSREEGQPKAEDIVNVAKISFAQGVAVGHNIEHSAQVQHGQTKHADKITTERAAMAMAERQVIQ